VGDPGTLPIGGSRRGHRPAAGGRRALRPDHRTDGLGGIGGPRRRSSQKPGVTTALKVTLEKRTAALEMLGEELSRRLDALERRLDLQNSNQVLHHHDMQSMKEGMEALEEQSPANSATREVMWRRIEALEGAPCEELPPLMAQLLRRLAAVEERLRRT
jgi:hypothetical protein